MPFWRGRFPCNVTAYCVVEVLIIRLKACVFSRVLSESLSSARPSTVTISPQHGQQRRTLVDNSTSWRAPPPYFPSYLLTKQRTAQSHSGRRSAPPLSSFKRWRKRRRLEKFQHAPADCEGHLSSVLTLLSQELWAPLHYFSSSMPPPESGAPLIPVGFAVFNRRVMQLASRGECDRARAGSSLVDFEGTFFFLVIFGKKLRARATRNKENNNSGLRCFSWPNENKLRALVLSSSHQCTPYWQTYQEEHASFRASSLFGLLGWCLEKKLLQVQKRQDRIFSGYASVWHGVTSASW